MKKLDNKVKIYKKGGEAIKIEINGQEMVGVTNIKINNDYAPRNSKESVIVEISNISLLEIITDQS